MYVILRCTILISLTRKVVSKSTIFFYRNGDSIGGISLSISKKDIENNWASFFLYLKKEAPTIVQPQSSTEDWSEFHLYDNNGTLLTFVEQIFNYDQQNLYAVPKNRPFYWPYIRTGHRAYIKTIDPERTFVLESLSASPRLFLPA